MRLDGYVARVAGSHTGVLETRPLEVGRFLLNARVRRAMRVDLMRSGAVVASCRVPQDDYVYRRACKLPTGRYAVRFTMRRSELYGVER